MLSTLHGLQVAGVRLAPGNYSVTPVPAAAFHLYVLCSLNRTASFTINLANSTLVLTVRLWPPSSWPICPRRLWLAMEHLSFVEECSVGRNLVPTSAFELGHDYVQTCLSVSGTHSQAGP